MPLMLSPFERTSCACSDCVAPCLSKPGFLIPADIFRITDRLVSDGKIESTQQVIGYLRASRGAVVGDSQTGKRFRIGTITPRLEQGRCVFLTEDNRCSIHSVSPFGCSAFDTHMDQREGDIRSLWGLLLIAGTPAYEQARQLLIQKDGEHEPFIAPTDEEPED